MDPKLFTWEHFQIAFGSATALALLAHAVNTFPTPKNPYGAWLLGVIRFGVGQRQSAANTFAGNDTASLPVVRGTGDGNPTVAPVIIPAPEAGLPTILIGTKDD